MRFLGTADLSVVICGLGDFFYGLVSVVGRVLGGLPVVLALQLLLGSLHLLDASRLVYYPTIHRATITRVFSLGFSLVVPLAVLLVAWFALMLVGERRWLVVYFLFLRKK